MRAFILSILILVVACDSKPVTNKLTGNLYFSYFRFFRVGNYYNQPDSVINWYETYYDTLKYETADDREKKLLTQYRKLKKENLLYKPFVDILVGKDSVVALYLDNKDYDEIKKYKRKKLQGDHKKIKIEADVFQVDDGLFYCVKLRKVEVVDGETLEIERKFEIEDYE